MKFGYSTNDVNDRRKKTFVIDFFLNLNANFNTLPNSIDFYKKKKNNFLDNKCGPFNCDKPNQMCKCAA